MGGFAARKALKVVSHVETCIAIELLCACQAIDFLRPLKVRADSGTEDREERHETRGEERRGEERKDGAMGKISDMRKRGATWGLPVMSCHVM
jgi:hypothetical protein